MSVERNGYYSSTLQETKRKRKTLFLEPLAPLGVVTGVSSEPGRNRARPRADTRPRFVERRTLPQQPAANQGGEEGAFSVRTKTFRVPSAGFPKQSTTTWRSKQAQHDDTGGSLPRATTITLLPPRARDALSLGEQSLRFGRDGGGERGFLGPRKKGFHCGRTAAHTPRLEGGTPSGAPAAWNRAGTVPRGAASGPEAAVSPPHPPPPPFSYSRTR